MQTVSIIIPCYNEASNIEAIKEAIERIIINYTLEFIFIDDGSTDNSLSILKDLAKDDKRIKYISFSRNFGHQYAIKAGIDHATGDCVVTMDADLQHKPEVVLQMLEKWQQGFDIVYTVKNNTNNLPFFKKITARLFNTLFHYLADGHASLPGADFRLIDKHIAEILKTDFQEYHLFYRGIIGWIGFKQHAINYTPEKRLSGRTKYSYKKMGNFAADGITSFSIKPLRMVTLSGLFISIFAFAYGLYALYISFFTTQAITGWTSVILSILIIGGLQLLFLGVIGEYLGKMFFEIKKRPHYLIKEKKIS